MQVQQERRTVETEGLEYQAKKFQISQNKRMFEILSSNIYSDKILAVIREYSCNAYDAHVAAGKSDVPFMVHLPNAIEPWFAVKDYGTGLCHEDVMGLYSTYGYSTKNNSNDAIGMLGLGSKSGFAYTDQFIVTSVFEGKSMIYSAFIDEEGSPTITLLSEEDTSEAPGLEINIPVKEDDFNYFAEKAAKVFFRFPVQPEIVGNVIELPQVKYPMQGENYKIRDDDRSYYDRERGAYAIQGIVAYPIKVSAFNSDGLTPQIKKLLSDIPIDITFPIGSLDVAASREELNYDKFTQANIIEAAAKILADIPNQFREVLSECETLWEAKKFWYKWMSEAEDYSKALFDLSGEKLQWNGQVIENNTINFRLSDLVESDTMVDPISGEKMKIPLEWGMCSIFGSGDLKSSGKSSPSHVLQGSIPAKDDTIVVIEDKVFKAPVRSIATLFEYKQRVFFFRNVKPENYQRLLDTIGNPPNVIYTSTLEEPPPPPKEVKTKSEIRTLYQIRNFGNYRIDELEVDVDLSKGGLYVIGYNKEFVHPNATKEKPNQISHDAFYMLKHFVSRLQLHSLKDEPVYFFNSTHRKRAEEDPLWISIYKHIEPKLRSIYTKKNKALIRAWSFFKDVRGDMETYLDFVETLEKKEIDKPSFMKPFKEFKKQQEIINKTMGTSYTVRECCDLAYEFFELAKQAHSFYSKIPKIEPVDVSKLTNKLLDQIYDRYPCFFTIKNGYNIGRDTILHYIDLCDVSKKCVNEFVLKIKKEKEEKDA